ncbi:hypothetical protein T4E_4311 [Trichinella pseudospiralis]|uniref:Uncharacterized protein n=1 Tax=Trichinella pseudospiralis TaxID=6337 RepID=A0A0V0YDH0_TRIPS|nr:hypothetical protein T4E_4311 [Trichinella pseudospiralis]
MGLVASFVRNVYIRAVGNSCLKRWQCLVQGVHLVFYEFGDISCILLFITLSLNRLLAVCCPICRLHLPFYVYKHNSSGKDAQSCSSCILSQISSGRALPLTAFCIKSMVASKSDYIVVPALYWGLRPLSRKAF